MAGWDGSGGFTLTYSWTADLAAGIPITASRMNQQFANVSVQGFGNTLTRDGQGQPSANLPMNGFKHTGAALASANGQYLVYQQVTGGSLAGVFTTLRATQGLLVDTLGFTVVSGDIKATSGSFVQSGGNNPGTASSPGAVGQLAWDSGFIYVCVATNTWKRAALSTW